MILSAELDGDASARRNGLTRRRHLLPRHPASHDLDLKSRLLRLLNRSANCLA
jgi:hypothetical protein